MLFHSIVTHSKRISLQSLEYTRVFSSLCCFVKRGQQVKLGGVHHKTVQRAEICCLPTPNQH